MIVEKVGEVILAHSRPDNRGAIRRLSSFDKEDLAYIPMNYIINNVGAVELLEVWNKLPKQYVENSDLQNCLPCYTHYNQEKEDTYFDGPPPSKNKCYYCKLCKI